MSARATLPRALARHEIDAFVRDGFVKVERAFPREVGEQARAILWRDTGCDPNDASTWTKPVIRLGMYAQQPFREAASGPVLANAFDQLVGAARWRPLVALGTFPVRFPSTVDPGDTGWHVDTSFAGPPDDPTTLPSVPRACRPAPPRYPAALHGAATASARAAGSTGHRPTRRRRTGRARCAQCAPLNR